MVELQYIGSGFTYKIRKIFGEYLTNDGRTKKEATSEAASIPR